MTTAAIALNAPLTGDLAKKLPPAAITAATAATAYLVTTMLSHHIAPDIPAVKQDTRPVVYASIHHVTFPHTATPSHATPVASPAPVRHEVRRHPFNERPARVTIFDQRPQHTERVAAVVVTPTPAPFFIRPTQAPLLTQSHLLERLFLRLFGNQTR